MRDLLAVARLAKDKAVAEATYAAAREGEAGKLVDAAMLALAVFDGKTSTRGHKFVSVRQYPGVVVKSQYDQPEYRVRVRYERSTDDIEIAAERTTGYGGCQPDVVRCQRSEGPSSGEELERALVQVAQWIGENLK